MTSDFALSAGPATASVFPGSHGADRGEQVSLEEFVVKERAQQLGRVVRIERLFAVVATEEGSLNLSTSRLSSLAVGDWLGISWDSNRKPELVAIAPRKGVLARRASGNSGRAQLLAANADVVMIVLALDQPVEPALVERYLSVAINSAANTVIVASKIDLVPDAPAQIRALEQLAIEVPVVGTSFLNKCGVQGVLQYMQPGTTTALVGPSGVGKSSLVNLAMGSEVSPTGEVRKSDFSGKHTTTWRQLVCLGNGAVIIDTPGLRALGMWDMHTGIEKAFSDVVASARRCHYSNCSHEGEDGCAVAEAIGQGLFDQRRVGSYRELTIESAAGGGRASARS